MWVNCFLLNLLSENRLACLTPRKVHVIGVKVLAPKKKSRQEKQKYLDRGSRSITQQALYEAHAPKELVDRVRRDIKRRQFDYLTPYLLSEKYTVTISTAKKILKELVEEGAIRLFSAGRRSPIYVPANQ